jgi:hypothetical protein
MEYVQKNSRDVSVGDFVDKSTAAGHTRANLLKNEESGGCKK